MGASEKHDAAWHGTESAQPKPTAADVLHQVIDTFLDDRPMNRMSPQQERAWLVDVLAAESYKALATAGLLATPEHDAQVAARALRDAACAVQPLGGVIGATASYWLDARAHQIAGGAT